MNEIRVCEKRKKKRAVGKKKQKKIFDIIGFCYNALSLSFCFFLFLIFALRRGCGNGEFIAVVVGCVRV